MWMHEGKFWYGENVGKLSMWIMFWLIYNCNRAKWEQDKDRRTKRQILFYCRPESALDKVANLLTFPVRGHSTDVSHWSPVLKITRFHQIRWSLSETYKNCCHVIGYTYKTKTYSSGKQHHWYSSTYWSLGIDR